MAREQRFPEEARANAGEQDDGIEFAAQETGREVEGFVMVFERDFAHGWRDEWLPALLADERGDLLGAAAFEREDAATVEWHIQIVGERRLGR